MILKNKMRKFLAALGLAGLCFTGCINYNELIKERLLEKIEIERTFSSEDYQRYFLYSKLDMELGAMLELYDLDRNGKIDVSASFDLIDGSKNITKKRASFVMVYIKEDGDIKNCIIYYDRDGDGILEKKQMGKEIYPNNSRIITYRK